MRALIFALLITLFAVPVGAEPMTPQEFAELYIAVVDRSVAATRMRQLYGQLPANLKPTAAAMLRQDLTDALAAKRGQLETNAATIAATETEVGNLDLDE
jgi:hypothetical protein